MNSIEHERHHGYGDAHPADSLNRVAFSATVHCLAGCSIGDVRTTVARPHLFRPCSFAGSGGAAQMNVS